ncbi:unnamed protein product [Arabis nemorensis]|uniref:EF-hand domain-containing protein n=1 Tax=Arabis nemorensis TaxID=586526 RepID=A0A565ATS3_9BRAS|nr:unnamed protein product [Arabis nemorensis]
MLPKQSNPALFDAAKSLEVIEAHTINAFRSVKDRRFGFSDFKDCIAAIQFTIGDSDLYHLLEKLEEEGGLVDQSKFMKMFFTQYKGGPLYVAFESFAKGKRTIEKKNLRKVWMPLG